MSKVSKQRQALNKQLVYEFHRLVFAANTMVANFAADLGINDRDGDGLLLIWSSEISGEPISPSELADGLHITRAAASYLVDRLVDLGYVTRHLDPNDRRRSVLRIAEADNEHRHDFTGSVDRNFSKVFQDRTNAELAAFTAMLADLVDNIGETRHLKQTKPNP